MEVGRGHGEGGGAHIECGGLRVLSRLPAILSHRHLWSWSTCSLLVFGEPGSQPLPMCSQGAHSQPLQLPGQHNKPPGPGKASALRGELHLLRNVSGGRD